MCARWGARPAFAFWRLQLVVWLSSALSVAQLVVLSRRAVDLASSLYCLMVRLARRCAQLAAALQSRAMTRNLVSSSGVNGASAPTFDQPFD